MLSRSKVLAGAVVTAALVLTACGSDSSGGGGDEGGGESLSWEGYSYNSTGIQLEAVTALTDELTDLTDGALEITMHPGGSLGIEATNIAQAVGTNSVQFADDGFYYGSVPVAGVLMLPMLYESAEQVEEAFEVAQPVLQERMNDMGVEIVGHYQYPHQRFFTSEPVTGLADLAGLSIRTSSPQQQALVEALGAQPVTIGTPEVATALEQGVVDGVMTAASGGGRLWADSLTHLYPLRATPFVSLLLVNKAEFEKLSEENQEAVREAAQEAGDALTARMQDEEEKVTAQLEDGGMVVTEPSQADIDAATDLVDDYWEQWAVDQGPEAEELLSSVREVTAK